MDDLGGFYPLFLETPISTAELNPDFWLRKVVKQKRSCPRGALPQNMEVAGFLYVYIIIIYIQAQKKTI